MQYCAAPRLDAACRMRFSLKKCWTTPRPRPSPPRIAACGTRTLVSDTRAWSVGMLKVQRYSSTANPGASVGTRNAVIPWPSPAVPLVRAKIRSASAACTPVFQVFSPSIDPDVAVADGAGLHVGRVRAVIRLGDAEREEARAVREAVHPLRLLRRRAVLQHQQQADVVADDRVLVLQIAVQAEPLARRGARG